MKAEEKIERVKNLLRNFGTNLFEIEECHRWNSPINTKNLPGLQAEQEKIASEICQIAADLQKTGVAIGNDIKAFSEEISKNVKGNLDNKYYYRIWKDILKQGRAFE